MDSLSQFSTGTLFVNVIDENTITPVINATVQISLTGTPGNIVATETTDENGQTKEVILQTPPLIYSEAPSEIRPYAEYNILIQAEGYEPYSIRGCQVLAGQLCVQRVLMNELAFANEEGNSINIGPHTLYGNYPPFEGEEGEINENTGEIVLSRVVIPEYVVVHDGPPNSSAKDYYVRYKDYIKNVASSEIYATWPEAAIYANILCIMSFTLNRVYTEFYRNRGKNFTITSSTAYDQKWIYGRNVYENISYLVDSVFNNYIARPGIKAPLFASYCDGQKTNCNGLKQWGSKNLAAQGYSAIEILRNYYGSDIYLASSEYISGVPASYPGYNLSVGSSGTKVSQLQRQLNRIARNYPAIPTITADGIYGTRTRNAISVFQQVFLLPSTGITDFATWYKVSEIYVAVTRISEP